MRMNRQSKPAALVGRARVATAAGVILVWVGLGGAGCMGANEEDRPEPTAKEVFADYVSGARPAGPEGSFWARQKMWRLLSGRMQRDYVVRWDAWNLEMGQRAQMDLQPLVRGEIAVFEGFAPQWAVAVVSTPRAAYAAPLVVEWGEWRIEPWGALYLSRRASNARQSSNPRIEVAVTSFDSQIDEARIWLDGKELKTEIRREGGEVVLRGDPADSFGPGKHLAVAFATQAGEAAALAWHVQKRQ